jgi:hypothetical protein
MTSAASRFATSLALAAAASVLVFATVETIGQPTQEAEPIAYVGHGAMFDSEGHQILPTAAWFARAQAWYRSRLLEQADTRTRADFEAFEKRLTAGLQLAQQATLVVQQDALEALRTRVKGVAIDERLGSKLAAMRYQLTWNLPAPGSKASAIWDGGEFRLDPEVRRRLDTVRLGPSPGGTVFSLATTKTGQDYIDQCSANQVPIPPTINKMDPAGTTGWKIQGEIPTGQQFIVQSPAEVRTFESPQGMCIALPRYNGAKTTVALDGVICLSKITSKVCIWDNQKGGATFSFPANQMIPIGKPDLAIDPMGRYQGGGAELTSPGGGICTDCHAGENPYIVHPDALLKPGVTFGSLGGTLPTFAPNRYDPIVIGSWPQNNASHAAAFVPAACKSCHFKGFAGRFPHLSNQYPGYCGTILRGAVRGLTIPPDLVNAPATMPQGAPGTLASNAAVNTFRAFCNNPPDAAAADLGDPHLTTVNRINYDFQSAGEFTALRNSDSGFELQTRQTPVVTTFIPGANPYTGLQSCVSLNTAAAFRLGEQRVSYQPSGRERMEVRVDGKVVAIPRAGLNLGGGNVIANAAAGGGIDVRAADGTRVLITPTFWSSQGYWYLNVDVIRTPAMEGTMGHILPGNFLPLAPDGSSFGPKPGPIPARYVLLNQKFADAWRVTAGSSLFDYAAGTTTATFTDKGWPAEPGKACSSPKVPAPGPTKPVERPVAERMCRPVINDKAAYDACVFDAMVMGDGNVGDAYRRTLLARAAAGP